MAWGNQRLDTEARLWVLQETALSCLERQTDQCRCKSSEQNRGSKQQICGNELGDQYTSLMGRQAGGEAKGLEEALTGAQARSKVERKGLRAWKQSHLYFREVAWGEKAREM